MQEGDGGQEDSWGMPNMYISGVPNSSSLPLSLSALVGSTGPHPGGESGWCNGLAEALGEIWATAL